MSGIELVGHHAPTVAHVAAKLTSVLLFRAASMLDSFSWLSHAIGDARPVAPAAPSPRRPVRRAAAEVVSPTVDPSALLLIVRPRAAYW